MNLIAKILLYLLFMVFLKSIILQVVNTFYTSLQCDLQCKDVVDKDLKAECEVQFCKKADEDEYDYGDI